MAEATQFLSRNWFVGDYNFKEIKAFINGFITGAWEITPEGFDGTRNVLHFIAEKKALENLGYVYSNPQDIDFAPAFDLAIGVDLYVTTLRFFPKDAVTARCAGFVKVSSPNPMDYLDDDDTDFQISINDKTDIPPIATEMAKTICSIMEMVVVKHT